MTPNRRDFLKKTGLALGATAVAGSAAGILTSSSAFQVENLANEEQVVLLHRFEAWVNEYIAVVEAEKVENREFKDNQALTKLPDELASWMPELKQHLSDKAFANEYLKVSDKLTQAISPQF